MSDRALILMLTWAAVAILALLLTGCGGSYRDSRELVLPDLAARVSAPEVPIGATPLGVVPTSGNRKALQTCLLFPAKYQMQCLLINL